MTSAYTRFLLGTRQRTEPEPRNMRRYLTNYSAGEYPGFQVLSGAIFPVGSSP
jgi:hypothetical protein